MCIKKEPQSKREEEDKKKTANAIKYLVKELKETLTKTFNPLKQNEENKLNERVQVKARKAKCKDKTSKNEMKQMNYHMECKRTDNSSGLF